MLPNKQNGENKNKIQRKYPPYFNYYMVSWYCEQKKKLNPKNNEQYLSFNCYLQYFLYFEIYNLGHIAKEVIIVADNKNGSNKPTIQQNK